MISHQIDNKTLELASRLLGSAGVNEEYIHISATISAVSVALVSALVIYWFLAYPVASFINHKINKSVTVIDDYLFPPKTVHAICMAVVTILATSSVPSLFEIYPDLKSIASKVLSILNIIAISYCIILVAKGFCNYLNFAESGRSASVVLRNLVTTIVAGIATLLIVSIVLNRDLAYVVSGLGAMAAILMLVFKDSILGMTAGVRLSVNKLLRINDWVSVPKYNAEGRVEDLTLTSVKIRNWDQSLTSIPPHALISDGFTNHESMLERGIRQIRRTFNVDVNSVRMLGISEIQKFKGEEWLFGIDLDTPQVNLTMFRKWLRNQMMSHPRYSSMPRVFVKEHPHTSTGIPIEIHFFVRCVDWSEFEELQADFLDRIIASIPMFHLRLFQSPAGKDLVQTSVNVIKEKENAEA